MIPTVGTLIHLMPVILSKAIQVVGVASALAAYTPTLKDDHFLAPLRKWLNVIALNVKNAGK